MTPTAKKLAAITECRQRVGTTFPTCRRQTKCLPFEGCSQQTHLLTLPAKVINYKEAVNVPEDMRWRAEVENKYQ